MINRTIDANVFVDDQLDVQFNRVGRYTTAQITGATGTRLAIGHAKRKPGDHDCRAVGQTLALSRALGQLSEHYRDLSVALDVVNSLDEP